VFCSKTSFLIFIFICFNFYTTNISSTNSNNFISNNNINKNINKNNFIKTKNHSDYESIKQEIEKCNFLQNKLTPQKKFISYKIKILNSFLQISAPLIFTVTFCKIIDYFFIYKKYSFKSKEIFVDYSRKYLDFLKGYKEKDLLNNQNNYISTLINNSNKKLKELDNKKFLINSSIFSITFSISYFLTNLFFKKRNKNFYYTLLEFLKNWQQNKDKIPLFFHDLFSKYLKEYSENNKISLNANQAKNFVIDIICQIIDYKSYLRRKIYL